MTTIIDHDLRVVNGKTLYMPPWEEDNDKWGSIALPDPYAIGKTQLYPTGTIYRYGLRTFIYTKTHSVWHGGSGGAGLGAGFTFESYAELMNLAASVTAGAAGQNKISVTTSASIAKNGFAGGFMGIIQAAGGLDAVGKYSTFQIISNLAEVANVTVFTLDGNLVNAFASGDDINLSEHPYALIRSPQTANYGMCIGLNVCTTVASSWLWVQTGGPHLTVAMIATLEGADPNSIPCYAIAGVAQISEGGVAGSAACNGIQGTSLQCIGYSMASTDVGGPGGTPTNITTGPSVFLTIFN